ncbi:MAG: sulfatase-like hydrolase/transferase [Burkholderiales bacterium]
MVDRPNFIFILADDLGYADLGCYGGRSLGAPRGSCSPNLDRMAAEGLRFTDGYSNSPVCSPTRFALATGRYQYRLRGGWDEPIAGRARNDPTYSPVLGLPPAHPTLPSLLAHAGYATALAGKWHLGYAPHFGPLKSGYQEFFGAMSGGIDYFTHLDTAGVHDLWEGETEVRRIGYLTDLISERAVDYLERRRGAAQPFLLSLHYTAPHWPWETRADEAEAKQLAASREHISHVSGGSVETYLTMIHHMDEGIGRLLAALADIGAERNTIVVFTSDNGGERFSDVWPLTGKKMDLLEGGIRVPYLVRWPARVKAGGVTPQLTITMDWVATLLEAAGVAPHPDYPLDGASLLSVLEHPARTFERELFWRANFRNQRALRAGRWKYLSTEDGEFLYDLARDARERANRVRREPERLEAMRARYAEWEKTVPGVPADAKASVVTNKGNMATPTP